MTRHPRQRQRGFALPRPTIALMTAVALAVTATPAGAFAAPPVRDPRRLRCRSGRGCGEPRGGMEVTRAEDSQAVTPEAGEPRTYVVQMELAPVVAYDGGVDGLKPTKPRGEGQDGSGRPGGGGVQHPQGAAAGRSGQGEGERPSYSYVYSFNGFAAELHLRRPPNSRRRPDVVAVHPDETVEAARPRPRASSDWTAKTDLWGQLAVPRAGRSRRARVRTSSSVSSTAASGPTSRSFSDRDEAKKPVYQGKPEGFRALRIGRDRRRRPWDANLCNNKLVTAQYFNAALGGTRASRRSCRGSSLAP